MFLLLLSLSPSYSTGVYYCDASNIINDRVQNVRSKKMTLGKLIQ